MERIIAGKKMTSRLWKLIAIAIFMILVLMTALRPTDVANSKPSNVPHSESSDMLCYMVTAKGKVVDLMHLCKQSIPDNVNSPTQSATYGGYPQISRGPQSYANYKGSLSYPTPPNLYDYQAMNNFDRQLYDN
jgi:hypothetical protein